MRAIKKATIFKAVEDGGPSSSMYIGGPGSNATPHLATNMMVRDKTHCFCNVVC